MMNRPRILTMSSMLVATLVLCTGGVAHANVFGVATSGSSADVIRTCNERYDEVRRAHELYTRLSAMDPVASTSLLDVEREGIAAVLQQSRTELLETSELTAADVPAVSLDASVDVLTVAAEALRSRAIERYHDDGCDDAFGDDLQVNLASDAAPTLTDSVGAEWRFHVGAAVTGNSGLGEEGEASAGFAPALGISYATNGHAFAMLIDPNVVEEGGATLDGESGIASAFGRQLLEARLGGRSMYASYTRYPWRRGHMTSGVTLRLVARQLEFTVQPGDDEAAAETTDTSFGVDGVLLAPTIAYTLTTSGVRFGKEEFLAGMQVGATMRSFSADLGALDAESQRALLTGSTDPDAAQNGVWAAGADLTFFMQYQSIAPFARITAMTGPSTTPRSMRGVQAVFGLDVLATIAFASEPEEG